VTLGHGEQLTLWADEDDADAPIDWMRSVAVIEAFDPAFHTAEGVHAGSPVTVVEGVYGPTVRIERSEIESREFIRFERQPKSLMFRLDYSGEFDEGARVTTRFRPGATIWSIAITSLGRGSGAQPLPSALPLAAAGPDSFLVEFATTKGKFMVRARRAWSPLGADRLHHLARAGYYDGVVIYRVGPTASYEGGFVVQFGIGNDSTVNAAWGETGIDDEPVRAPHGRGRIYFARGGPRTRSVELALDLTANSPLDTVRYEGVIGFPPIGEVVAGMSVLDSLNRQYGNTVFEHWDSVSTRGRAYLDRAYPGLDRIDSARVVRTWPAPTTEESP
jgi:cyclophilin family peptidyl-prolyl cis-trans isomerase